MEHLYIYIYPGETSLMKATQNEDIEVLKILLKHGADVNSKDGMGE